MNASVKFILILLAYIVLWVASTLVFGPAGFITFGLISTFIAFVAMTLALAPNVTV